MSGGVIDGIRTRDTRDHNPVLYQLSYDHHRNRERGIRRGDRPMIAGPSGLLSTGYGPPHPARYRAGSGQVRDSATALAASTSGPGSGTKIVCR